MIAGEIRMADCVFCGRNAIGGWTPSFGKAGICSGCLRSLEEKICKDDRQKIKNLEQEVDRIKRDLGRR